MSKIKTQYTSFTKAEKKVADYILKHPSQVVYMSITDVADACHIGESSVFRFCKSMGLKGYQELKIILAHTLHTEKSDKELTDEISLEDSFEDLTQKILTSNSHALTETYQLIEKDLYLETIESMIQAKNIYFFGVGSSQLTALDANNKFLRITKKSRCITDPHLQIMTASLLDEQDVAIFFSYSGSTIDTNENARIASERGAKVIAITRFAKSPLTNYADISLLCGANESPLHGGSLSAKISQLLIIDILYTEYLRRTNKESTDNKRLTSDAVLGKLY